MHNELTINDYTLASTANDFSRFSTRTGFAKVEIFSREIEFCFSDEDAVIAGIELGLIEQPDDSDHTRIGYAKPYFSATVYENLGFEKGIQYTDNQTVLADYEATEYGEQIVTRLALQSSEVREVIQAEAHRIALSECPIGTVEPGHIAHWFYVNKGEEWDLCGIDWNAISEYMKQSYYAAEQETLSQL